jgi:hypothetical protein
MPQRRKEPFDPRLKLASSIRLAWKSEPDHLRSLDVVVITGSLVRS